MHSILLNSERKQARARTINIPRLRRGRQSSDATDKLAGTGDNIAEAADNVAEAADNVAEAADNTAEATDCTEINAGNTAEGIGNVAEDKGGSSPTVREGVDGVRAQAGRDARAPYPAP